KTFFAAVDHVDQRARDLGWKYLGVDLYPEGATKYRDENGRQLTWEDFDGNVIRFYWLPDPGSEGRDENGRQLTWEDFDGNVIRFYWLPDPGSEAVHLGFNFDTNAFVGGFTKTVPGRPLHTHESP